jgi:hypothetical protein
VSIMLLACHGDATTWQYLYKNPILNGYIDTQSLWHAYLMAKPLNQAFLESHRQMLKPLFSGSLMRSPHALTPCAHASFGR